MCVGMNRRLCGLVVRFTRVPHVRGDEPMIDQAVRVMSSRSPCAWG